MRFLAVTFATAMLCTGCTADNHSIDTGDLAITNGTPEAIGVLTLLNSPETTTEVLDKNAGLNIRSARNLMHHRNGWDGTLGTYDDNLFGSIEEVDSVRWVGPTAMAQLIDFAATEGYIPEGADILGTWDGVTFTVVEAALVLDYVNEASHGILDHEAGLDRRAVDSIVAAQPIATVEEPAGLYYVGRGALEALLDVAVQPVAITAGQFLADLEAHLVAHYELLGDDILALGGNHLDDALLGLDETLVELLSDSAEDPYGHDLDTVIVLSHPDVVFSEGDAFWFAAYDASSGALLDVYVFE